MISPKIVQLETVQIGNIAYFEVTAPYDTGSSALLMKQRKRCRDRCASQATDPYRSVFGFVAWESPEGLPGLLQRRGVVRLKAHFRLTPGRNTRMMMEEHSRRDGERRRP